MSITSLNGASSHIAMLASSMPHFVGMFFFGFVLLFSWIGWGWIVSRVVLRAENRTAGWFAGAGLAVTLILGGVLNLFALISKLTLMALVATGLAGFLAYLVVDRGDVLGWFRHAYSRVKRNGWLIVLVLAVTAAILIKYSAAISPGMFNPHDDYQGYFVFPVKMLQCGTMGADPFSERRIVSSLGGQAFLDTFMLLFGDERNFHFADGGVGCLAFLLATFCLLRSIKASRKYRFAILMVAAFIHAPIANITSMYTGLALFVMLVWLLRDRARGRGDVVLLALIVSALCSLKNSFVPISTLFLFTVFLFRYLSSRNGRGILLEITCCSLLLTVLLLPWMISSYWSSGTLLYPLLGQGFYGCSDGTFAAPISQINLNSVHTFLQEIQNVLVACCAILVVLWGADRDFRGLFGRDDLALCALAICGVAIVGLATAGYGVGRYTFPFMVPIVLVLASDLAALGRIGISMSKYTLLSLVLLGMLAGPIVDYAPALEQEVRDTLSFGLLGKQITTPQERVSYCQLQKSVPAGARVLARLEKNYLLDFARNQVYIVDYPGGASLPPGMPFFRGPEPLADYLVKHSIRYVAFAYSTEALFTKDKFGNRLQPKTDVWIKTEALHTFDFQDNLKLLRSTRRRVFDDGNNFVLDLAARI